MTKKELFSAFHGEFEELRKHYTHCCEVEQELDARERVTKNNPKLSERGKADKLAELSDRRFSCRHEKERCISRLEKIIEKFTRQADDLDHERVLAEPLDNSLKDMLYSNLLSDNELIALSRSSKMSGTLNRRALLNVMGTIAERKNSEKMRLAAAELRTRFPEPDTKKTVVELGSAMTRIMNSDPTTAAAIYSRAYKPAVSELITEGNEDSDGDE